MKQILLAGLCLIAFVFQAEAQNKTLGVGTSTLNANAALHVESPTNNQGVIFPRLTTAQRLAMDTILTAADEGVMLYDKDLNGVYIWDGTAWQTSDDVTTTGSGNGSSFSIVNPSSAGYAVYATTNGDSLGAAVHGNNTGNGFGLYGKSAGTKFASAAVYGYHVGTGDAAGAFRIENTSNAYSAVYGETNGSGAAVYGLQIGTSTAASAGYFQVGTATNQTGTGPAVFGAQRGLGRAGQFQINNPANSNAAIRGFTDGTGNAGFFTVNNTLNTLPAIFVTTNGQGPAFSSETTSAGNTFAGLFRNNTSSNTFPAIQTSTAGSGPGLRVLQDATSTGGGMDVFIQNTSSTAQGLAVSNSGLGTSGSFSITNSSSSAMSLYSSTNGTGAALFSTNTGTGRAGIFTINNAASTVPAIYASTNGAFGGNSVAVYGETATAYAGVVGRVTAGFGNGVVGISSSPEAGSWAVLGENTGAGSGGWFSSVGADPTVGITSQGTGYALEIQQGGIKLTTSNVTTSSITTRASAYSINSGGTTFTMSLPNGMTNGEVFFIYNNTGSAITVNSVPFAIGEGRTCVVLGGSLRGM
jgi:hypothetical protein